MHTFQRLCAWRGSPIATCNCGAAIKSGDDVIFFDTCGDTPRGTHPERQPLTVQFYTKGELTAGTSIVRNGGTYIVSSFLPS